MVALSGKDARGTFDQLEIIMCRWRDIEACLERPGPFIYTATRTVFPCVAHADTVQHAADASS